MSYRPVPPPAHLPERLTITLWDFSWYVRTGPGEPFEDLDGAFAEAVERGYNTVRICAMPYLLFGSGLDTSSLELGPLGGGFGQRVRWYDVKEPTVIDARAHLIALFEAARRHNCYVIISSWEYQQSSSFATQPDWCQALMGIDPDRRAEAQAAALAELIDFLAEHDLDDRVAFTEIHNEVQVGHLADGLPNQLEERIVALRPRLEGRSSCSTDVTPTARSRSTTPACRSARCGASPTPSMSWSPTRTCTACLVPSSTHTGCAVAPRTSTKLAPSGTSCSPGHQSSPSGRPTSRGD